MTETKPNKDPKKASSPAARTKTASTKNMQDVIAKVKVDTAGVSDETNPAPRPTSTEQAQANAAVSTNLENSSENLPSAGTKAIGLVLGFFLSWIGIIIFYFTQKRNNLKKHMRWSVIGAIINAVLTITVTVLLVTAIFVQVGQNRDNRENAIARAHEIVEADESADKYFEVFGKNQENDFYLFITVSNEVFSDFASAYANGTFVQTTVELDRFMKLCEGMIQYGARSGNSSIDSAYDKTIKVRDLSKLFFDEVMLSGAQPNTLNSQTPSQLATEYQSLVNFVRDYYTNKS